MHTMPPNQQRRNMQLIRNLVHSTSKSSAVAIGNFDGLHLGHQAVIGAMMGAAQARALVPSVLTFEPHPRRFFAPQTPPFRIAPLHDKLVRLREAGVVQLLMPRFNQAFASMPAEKFLEDVLGRILAAKAVVTGENFAFGHKRGGNSAMLQAWGDANDVQIITVPPVLIAGQVCSSSAVRAAICVGDMRRAHDLLGRHYCLAGRVVHGEGRGRGIGFPTANVALLPGLILPALGVYAVRATIDNATYAGVANLGLRPTIGDGTQPRLEVHLFDFEHDIYGKRMMVSLVEHVRPEKKFDSVAALAHQIRVDSDRANMLLRGSK